MKERTSNKSTFKSSVIATIPVMAGYLVLGTAFGILLADKGYGLIWALIMSVGIYAGSMQFAAVGLLTGGATLVSAALLTLLVNARHLIYGISMLDKYRGMGIKKPYLIFALTDETYALLCTETPEGVDKKRYCFYVSLLDQLYWVTGSVAGSLIGSALTIDTAGIDFAMTALFVVIFTEQWIKAKDHIPAVIGAAVSVICLVIFGAESFLIPSMAAIVLLLTVRTLIKEKRNERHNA